MSSRLALYCVIEAFDEVIFREFSREVELRWS